jgi:SagB-type dehydrogenase family enzyme
MDSRFAVGTPIERRLFLAGLGVTLLAGCTRRGSTSTGEATSVAGVATAAATPTAPAGRTLGSLLDAIKKRRSTRAYTSATVEARDIALMAWSAQGITDTANRLRAAPSAMAAYPLRLYVATAAALRLYEPDRDGFNEVRAGDVRPELFEASGQTSVQTAPAVFVVTGRYGVLEADMGEKAQRCVHLEAGHATQNLMLTATSLGLAGVTAGTFEDSMVQKVLGVSDDETPLYLVPIGHPA